MQRRKYVFDVFSTLREEIDWKVVAYEAAVGGTSSVIRGVGSIAKKAEKTVKTVKAVFKGTLKTGAAEATGAISGVVGMSSYATGELLDFNKQLSDANKRRRAMLGRKATRIACTATPQEPEEDAEPDGKRHAFGEYGGNEERQRFRRRNKCEC